MAKDADEEQRARRESAPRSHVHEWRDTTWTRADDDESADMSTDDLDALRVRRLSVQGDAQAAANMLLAGVAAKSRPA